MNSNTSRIFLSLIAIFLTVGFTLARSYDFSDIDSYEKYEDALRGELLDRELYNYILERSLRNQKYPPLSGEVPKDPPKKKQGTFTPCAFNAISCFGKK